MNMHVEQRLYLLVSAESALRPVLTGLWSNITGGTLDKIVGAPPQRSVK